MWIPKIAAVAATLLAMAACTADAQPAVEVTPPPSHQAMVDSGEYIMPPLQEAATLGFTQTGAAQKARELLKEPPKGFDTQRYLPDWHNNNELHPYVPAGGLPRLPGLVLWGHHSSVAGVVNRVHLVEFTQGEPGGGVKPWKYRCAAPLLKKGAGLAGFLAQLPDRFSYLPTEVGQYAFVMLGVELQVPCVRVE